MSCQVYQWLTCKICQLHHEEMWTWWRTTHLSKSLCKYCGWRGIKIWLWWYWFTIVHSCKKSLWMAISSKIQFLFFMYIYIYIFFEILQKNLINLLLLEILCQIHYQYLFLEKRRIEVEEAWRWKVDQDLILLWFSK